MKFAKLFWNSDAIREANATFKNRIAEINAEAAAKETVIEAEKIAAKAAFRDRLARNKAERDRKFAAIDSAKTADEAIAVVRS